MSILRTPIPFWRETGPKVPWGPFDPDAKLNFSFDMSPWVTTAGPGLTLESCDVIGDPLLTIDKAIEGSTVTVGVRAATPSSLPAGSWLSFTLRMQLSDGQRDDRTFWLLVRSR
jgi:hypothetical protein